MAASMVMTGYISIWNFNEMSAGAWVATVEANASCRESHDADVIGVDVPLLGMCLHGSDGFVSIRLRHGVVAMRHTVFQHDGGDAAGIEEWCPLVTFMVHGRQIIATTGTDDHRTGGRCASLGQINGDAGLVIPLGIIISLCDSIPLVFGSPCAHRSMLIGFCH